MARGREAQIANERRMRTDLLPIRPRAPATPRRAIEARAALRGGDRGRAAPPGLTAPFIRQRFQEPRAYVVNVDLSAADPVVATSYELRIRPAIVNGRVEPSPLRLELPGDERTWFVVRPVGARGRSAGSPVDYSVRAGVYRVLADGFDSLEVCRKPCSRSIMVSLGQSRARIAK